MTNILYIVENLSLEENVEDGVKIEKDEIFNLYGCSIDLRDN